MVKMLQESAIAQQLQEIITAYMRGESPFYEAQSVMVNRLKVLVRAIAQDVRYDYGDIPMDASSDEQERRKRSVFAQLIIGAERQARDDGRPLETTEIEKLLRLMCWMCDTAEALGKHRSLPTASEAA